MKLDAMLDPDLLAAHLAAGNVREQAHPFLPLRILNYTEKCAYDGTWDAVTRSCRGLIYDAGTGDVVARPFPKFFNYGQPGAPELDLDAPAIVTDKLDGSLGILYPTPDGHAVATRGSFTSEQAVHATDLYRRRYEGRWEPQPGCTYLYEVLYPGNRIVCDYGGLDDLVLLGGVHVETGRGFYAGAAAQTKVGGGWPGPTAATLYETLREALEAEPRPNAEGVVVWFPNTDERVKIKQADYVALHRIVTGLNARNVWELAAVHACAPYVTDPKQWGSYLRIDPARAAEVLALEDGWLAGVPDEFFAWIQATISEAETRAYALIDQADVIVAAARAFTDRRARYEYVSAMGHPAVQELMRLAEGRDEHGRLVLRCWLAARPDAASPFARTEATA